MTDQKYNIEVLFQFHDEWELLDSEEFTEGEATERIQYENAPYPHARFRLTSENDPSPLSHLYWKNGMWVDASQA